MMTGQWIILAVTMMAIVFLVFDFMSDRKNF